MSDGLPARSVALQRLLWGRLPPPTTAPPPTTQPPPPECSGDKHRHGSTTCHADHEPPCGVGTWDPGHGHERVDRQACAYGDASHALGPITYCGTQSQTHRTRHFHYGGNGCHAIADVHPKDPPRYTGVNACANWKADVNAAIKNASSTYPLPPTGTDCGSLGVHLKNILGHVERGVDVFVDQIEAELAALVEDLETLNDARLRGLIELQKLYNNLSDEQQIVLDLLICAGPTTAGGTGGFAVGGPPGTAVGASVVGPIVPSRSTISPKQTMRASCRRAGTRAKTTTAAPTTAMRPGMTGKTRKPTPHRRTRTARTPAVTPRRTSSGR